MFLYTSQEVGSNTNVQYRVMWIGYYIYVAHMRENEIPGQARNDEELARDDEKEARNDKEDHVGNEEEEPVAEEISPRAALGRNDTGSGTAGTVLSFHIRVTARSRPLVPKRA